MLMSHKIASLALALCMTGLSGCGGDTTAGNTTTAPTVATLENTALAPSSIAVLTLNTGTNTVGASTGTYIHSSSQATVDNSSFAVNANGNSYVGSITGGGDYQIVALQTASADMPTSGTATYSGTANVAYLDTPSGRLFDGTMDAAVTADFGASTVGIELVNPDGAFGGATYTGPGQVAISGLALSGNTYVQNDSSTASVTGFTGATGLNSGSQTIAAQGIFGGPTANETGATAVILDAENGQALVSLTARQ